MPQAPAGTSVDVFRSGAITSAFVSPNTSLNKSCSCLLYPAGVHGLVNLGAVSLHAHSRWSSISHVFHFQYELDEKVTSCSDEADYTVVNVAGGEQIHVCFDVPMDSESMNLGSEELHRTPSPGCCHWRLAEAPLPSCCLWRRHQRQLCFGNIRIQIADFLKAGFVMNTVAVAIVILIISIQSQSVRVLNPARAFVGNTKHLDNEIDFAGSEGVEGMRFVNIKHQKICPSSPSARVGFKPARTTSTSS